MISQWSTPIATAVPISSSTPEPLSVVLLKQNLEINERIRQVCANIMHAGPTRILSDTSAVLEQLPNLLLLLKEASSPNVWLTEESANLLVDLFGLKSSKSLSRLLLQGTATFVFPLSSMPASIDWTSSDFSFFKHLSYNQRRSLIDLHAKTMQLDAIDYFFFVLGVLSVTSSTSAWSGSTWPSPNNTAWYDSGNKGRVYDRIIIELLELVLGTENRGNIPPALLHKAELTFAALSDIFLDLNLYSFNNTSVDFGHVFELVSMIFKKLCVNGALDNNSSFLQTTSVGLFVSKAGKLLGDLLDTSNAYSVKFMHRISCMQFHEFSRLYRTFCLPWEDTRDITKASRDAWTRRYGIVYHAYSAALTVPRIVDFVHEYRSSAHADHMRFATAKETRCMVDGITELLSIASPSTGLVELLPTVFTDAPIKPLWDICRGCTWIHGKVPKELTDASWRMDTMVNAAKAIQDDDSGIYSTFTWETQESIPADEVPKNLKTNWLRDKEVSALTGPVHVSSRLVLWDQPVCSSEIGLVVYLLRSILTEVGGINLKLHPEQYAWVRSFASVTVLVVIAFSAWMLTSMFICPHMDSSVRIAVIQFIFMLIVGLLSMKWIASQYIV